MMKFNKIFALCIFLAFVCCAMCGKPTLIVSNNGPAILGSNITFFASLINYSTEDNLNYIFSDGVVKETVNGNLSASLSRSFMDGTYTENSYNMTVTVMKERLLVLKKVVVANYTIFKLKEYIIGEIILLNENGEQKDDDDDVGVGENVTMAAKIYDPTGFFKDAVFDYEWSIDSERHRSHQPKLTYIYDQPRTSTIFLLINAKFTADYFKTGYFNKQLTVKVPVNAVNVSGNPFIHHGEILYLNISCNGTPPFEYCSQLLEKNETEENITCSQTVITTSCLFFVKRYFQISGTYHIGIYLSNDVKVVKRNIEVIVYTVSTKPLLSTVIIPIVCSLLTLIIISGGIAYHIHHRKHQTIEVANFDFLEESNTYTERTLFERMFDSFTCRTCILKSPVSEENDDFKDEIEPLLKNSVGRNVDDV